MFDHATNTAFLHAIREAPDDDAPRLIYADWLDEQGDFDRAEFIRGQIRLLELAPGTPDYRDLNERVAQLRQEHGIAWLADYPHVPGVHWEVWERGFISAVRFEDPDLYQQWADAVFAVAPITELRLHNYYWKNAVTLMGSPWLQQLRILDLEDGNRIGNTGIEALMDAESLRALRVLKLRGNALGSAGARAIAQSPYVRNLQMLDLQRNDLYEDGLQEIARSPNCKHLVRLDLDRTRTNDAGVLALAASTHVLGLQSLSLSGNNLTDDALMALAGSPVLQHVRHLFLQANRIGPRGIEALASSPYTTALENLFLRQNRLRDEGALALLNARFVDSLVQLYVGDNGISDVAAEQLRRVYGNRVNVF